MVAVHPPPAEHGRGDGSYCGELGFSHVGSDFMAKLAEIAVESHFSQQFIGGELDVSALGPEQVDLLILTLDGVVRNAQIRLGELYQRRNQLRQE